MKPSLASFQDAFVDALYGTESSTMDSLTQRNRLANTPGFLLRLLTMAPITFKWTPFAALPSGSHPLTKFLLTPFSVSVSGRVAGLSEKHFKAAR